MTDLEIGPKEGNSEHIEQKKPGLITVSVTRQAQIRKKFDGRILPIVCALYVLSYLDRSNIGNTKTAGADRDLSIDSTGWSWVLNAFYISYVLFEWAAFFWKIFPAHIHIALLCVCWGAAAMTSGAVQNMTGLIVCRCLLGVFEAFFGAGAPYFLSLFNQRNEQLGVRVSVLLGMSPVANCFTSALAYGITHIRNSIEPWRLLFIIEGAPTVLFVVIVYLFLADSPGTARFLNEHEQTEAIERLQTVDRTAKGKMQWNQVFAGLPDYKNYVHTLIHFCCNYSFAGLSNFLPTIIEDMGYSSINAQGLSAPAYFASFLLCFLAAYVSGRWERRGFVVAGFAAIGTVGYLVLATVRDESKTGARYVGIWLAAGGVFPALCINITWLLNNQGGDSKRGIGLSILAVFGQCSSFVSSVVFPDEDGPFYLKRCAIGCGLTGLIVFLALGLRFKLEQENRKRDLQHGAVDENVRVDVTDGGDKNKQFRYLT